MVTEIPPATKAIGFWSAVLATVFSITYVVGQLAEWAGLMGSGGGAENASTPLGLVVLLTPSLFLGSSFLVLVVSIHQLAFLTANGLLLPFIALQMYCHPLIWIAALWAVTFPGSTWSLAILFRHTAVKGASTGT